MRRKIQLTESQLISVIKRVISEQSEHVKNLYKSWANKRSGNPEEALKLMDDVFKYQKKLSKKDFAQYSSYEELRRDLVRIKSEERSTDATKIYEDNELLVLAANTWEASCKYGAGSKWCTTAKNDPSYWDRHNRTGTEFFWIFKNKPQDDPNHKFSYHIKINDNDPDWCNAINNCMSTTRLPEKSYPKQHPKYNEIIQKLKSFHDSRDMEMTKSGDEGRTISLENRRILENIIYDNENNIMEILLNHGVDRIVEDNYSRNIEYYIDDEVNDYFPDFFNDFDGEEYEDMVSDYIDELEEYLEKNSDVSFDTEMFAEMLTDITDLTLTFLEEKYDFSGDRYVDEQMEERGLTIVEVMEKILDDFDYEDQFNEILYEVIGTNMSSKIFIILFMPYLDYPNFLSK